MLQLLRNAIGNGGVEQCQMYGDVGIFVDNIHKQIADRESDGKLLFAFPNERLFFGFAGFYLAACKFPQQSPGFVGGRWQIMSAPPFQIRAATTSVMAVRLLSSGCFQYKSFCRFLQAASCPKQSSPEYWETNGELAE